MYSQLFDEIEDINLFFWHVIFSGWITFSSKRFEAPLSRFRNIAVLLRSLWKLHSRPGTEILWGGILSGRVPQIICSSGELAVSSSPEKKPHETFTKKNWPRAPRAIKFY